MGRSPHSDPGAEDRRASDGDATSPGAQPAADAAAQAAPSAEGQSESEGKGGGFAIAIATAGGAGFLPGMPGTFGAMVGTALFVPLSALPFGVFVLTLVALCALGTWASDRAEVRFGKKDDGRIVIDEVAGVLITLAPLVPLRELSLPDLGLAGSLPAWMSGNEAFFALVVTGFVLFRVFDIRKPGPVRWAERRFQGGFGVMADDIVAGLLGAVCLIVPAYVLVLAELAELAR